MKASLLSCSFIGCLALALTFAVPVSGQAGGPFDPTDPDTYLYNDSAAYDAVLLNEGPISIIEETPAAPIAIAPRYSDVASAVIYNDVAAYEHAHGRPFADSPQALAYAAPTPMATHAQRTIPTAPRDVDLFEALNTAPQQQSASIHPIAQPAAPQTPALATLGQPKTVSLAQGNYLVFGSFSNQDNALGLADQTGLMTATVMPIAVGAGEHYRVLAGPFFSNTDIEQAKTMALNNGAQESWILEVQ